MAPVTPRSAHTALKIPSIVFARKNQSETKTLHFQTGKQKPASRILFWEAEVLGLGFEVAISTIEGIFFKYRWVFPHISIFGVQIIEMWNIEFFSSSFFPLFNSTRRNGNRGRLMTNSRSTLNKVAVRATNLIIRDGRRAS